LTFCTASAKVCNGYTDKTGDEKIDENQRYYTLVSNGSYPDPSLLLIAFTNLDNLSEFAACQTDHTRDNISSTVQLANTIHDCTSSLMYK